MNERTLFGITSTGFPVFACTQLLFSQSTHMPLCNFMKCKNLAESRHLRTKNKQFSSIQFNYRGRRMYRRVKEKLKD